MGLFLHQLAAQGVMSPHPRPPVAYNCCVRVLCQPTTLQLIDETCTSRYSSTTATDWSVYSRMDKIQYVNNGFVKPSLIGSSSWVIGPLADLSGFHSIYEIGNEITG